MTTGRLALVLASVLATGCGATAPAADPSDFVEIPGIGSTRIDVPRPTSGSRSTCTADGLPTPSTETLTERVAALRAIGLFAGRADATDEAIATEVTASIKEAWGDQVAPDDPMIDLFIAEQDHDRVWWRDLEADVTDGNHVYEMTLAEWGEISAGAFEPSAISERWDSLEGPVSITFTLDGTEHTLHPSFLEDWIDLGVLAGINDLMVSSGRRFESYRAFDQTAFVAALTAEERSALERERGWCFE